MEGPFGSVEDVWRRSGVPASALEKLADADAFQALGLDRRQALWKIRGLGGGRPLPLFDHADARTFEPEVALAPLTAGREVVEDYRAVQLSLRDHPLTFLRAQLAERGIIPCGSLKDVKDGARVSVAGLILVRQRPGKGNVLFVTLEDETGIANALAWQRVFEAHRRIVMASSMIVVHGVVQKEGKVIHVVSAGMEDLTGLLATVGDRDFPHRTGPGDGAKNGGYDPRDRRAMPKPLDLYPAPFRHGPRAVPEEPPIKIKSRDFH